MFSMDKLDFISLGDIVTDAFIELEDAWVENDNPKGTQELCMRFGDKIPYTDVVVVPAVGNSPNAAVSAKLLGLNSALITDLGDDKNGKECLDSLKEKNVPCDLINIHPNLPTNYHYVLRFKAERTILVRHTKYPYKLPSEKLTSSSPKWLYLSSLADNSIEYHKEIFKWLLDNPQTKLAFQPGTFQIKLGHDALKDIYSRSEIFFCNKEESQRILNSEESDIKKLLEGVHNLGPKIAVITDGPKGAYTFDGNKYLHCPMYPDPKPPVERTGAGDAFSSTVTSALALGLPLEEAIKWGPINSMSVVQQIGAQKGLLNRKEIENLLANAPSDYIVSEIK